MSESTGSGRVSPARTADPPTARTGADSPSTLTASSVTAPFGFSSARDRRGPGLSFGQPGSPTPGRLAVVMAALMIGLLLMGTQLWLLTVALELYLGGHGPQVWLLALVSGAIFAGGVVMLRVLDRRPHLQR